MPNRGTDPTNLSAYAGRWVAILRGRVVGQGGTPRQALHAAKATRFKENPEIIYVPTSPPLSFSTLLDQIRPALPKNLPIYLVGGAVRDALLNRSTHDLDFVLEGDGNQIARRVANTLQVPFFPLDEERGTGRIVLPHPNADLARAGERYFMDFATFRGPDLESDLRARDFTINAMAVDVNTPDQLLDPLGGAADLLAKRLRACSSTALQDDPLRILRAVRLATTYNLQIAPETRHLMRAAVEGLDAVSTERKRDEILRILGGSQVATALRALDLLGALPRVFPELPALKGVTQSPPHVDDVWQHTLQTVQNLEKVLNLLARLAHDPDAAGSLTMGLMVLRLGRYRTQFHTHLQTPVSPDRPWQALLVLAALYHDVGKPATRQEDEAGRIRFFGHDQTGAEMLVRRAQAFHLSNPEIARLKNIVRYHMRPHLLSQVDKLPSRRAIYRFFRDTGEAGVDICLLALADVLATYGTTLAQDTWNHYLDILRELLEAWWERPEESVNPPALLNGHDLLETFKLSPGPEIGKILEMIREAQADGQITTQAQAFARVEHYLRDVSEPPSEDI
ncbi:MAG: HD domain-containing protein [Anaerolineales bacterium]|nr:HD domain-containing protein [Anaerolineales bacterium]